MSGIRIPTIIVNDVILTVFSGSNSVKASKGVQEDASKSEVYKSIFSSHATALNKPKGHWVTFDPRYN